MPVKKCEVCATVLSQANIQVNQKLGYSVCNSPECQEVMKQKSVMPPLFFKSHLEFNKRRILKRRKAAADKKQWLAKLQAKEKSENDDAYQTILEQHPGLNQQNTRLVIIPTGKTVPIVTSRKRIEKYFLHLQAIITEAGEYENADHVARDQYKNGFKRIEDDKKLQSNLPLLELSDRLCIMCKGGCCCSGQEHAYLSTFNMRLLMDKKPEWTGEDIFNLYSEKISHEIMQNSCINNTAEGCALPRELRSDVCNSYYCYPLAEYQKEMQASKKLLSVVAVQRESSNWDKQKQNIENNISNVTLLEV